MITDLAVAIADGATTISEIDTLRHQGELFGPVASDTTAWRTLSAVRRRGAGQGQQGQGEDPGPRLGPGRGPARRHPAGPGSRAGSGRGDRRPPRRHDRGRAQWQAAGERHVQGHLGPSSADGVVRQHRRVARGQAAARQRRQQHCRGPHRPGRRGDRADPRPVPAQDAVHLRRRRGHPRPGRSHRRAERPPRLPGPFLGRVRLRRADPRRPAAAAGIGMDPGPGRRRARRGPARRSPS